MKPILLRLALPILLALTNACQLSSPSPELTSPIVTTNPQLRKIATLDPVVAQPTALPGQPIPYQHPSGAFALNLPSGWEVETSEYGSVFASEVGGEGAIYLTVTNTGRALEGDAFEEFVYAREENFFAGFTKFLAVEQEIDTAQANARTLKTLEFNSIPQNVESDYLRQGAAIYVLDMWTDPTDQARYEVLYQEARQSLQVDASQAANFPIYNFIFTFYDNLERFSFEAPISWSFHYQQAEGTLYDQFRSPDGRSLLVHTLIDNAAGLTTEQQAERVVQALRSYLPEVISVPEIEQLSPQEDGSTRIIWAASPGGWQAFTSMQEFEGNLLALSGLSAPGDYAIYQSSIDYALKWYSIPAVQE